MMISERLKPLLALLVGNSGANIVYLVCLVVLGLTLDKENFGHFRVGYAYITIASSIALLGLNSSITKHFSGLTEGQKEAVSRVTKPALLISSVVAGVAAYAAMPVEKHISLAVTDILYLLCFPLAVLGATACNTALAVFQAEGRLYAYSRYQFFWRAFLFAFACVGGILGGGAIGLIALSLSYVLILPFFMKEVRGSFRGIDAIPDWSAMPRVVKSAVWPLASICVSTIYANAEFLYIKSTDIDSGYAGSYALASLIYQGGAAFFFPFQTYAISMIVNRKISLAGIFKLQALCFVSVASVAGCAVALAYGLNWYDQARFDVAFLDFSALVAIKLSVWGAYAVTGSVIYYVGKEFESFLLSVVALLVLGVTPYLIGIEGTVRNMVLLQILTGCVVLVGCTFLFVRGFKTYSEQEAS